MNQVRIPQAGDFYRHFKNKLYQIVTIAKHSETQESLVIYQALYGDYGIYARPLDMFISEVDHEKYPDVQQKYRFQYIEREEIQTLNQNEHLHNKESIIKNEQEQQVESSVTKKNARKTLTDFLDATSAHEKLEILNLMKNYLDDFTLDSIAVCLDYVPSGSTIEERYFSICQFLEMKMNYESKRW